MANEQNKPEDLDLDLDAERPWLEQLSELADQGNAEAERLLNVALESPKYLGLLRNLRLEPQAPPSSKAKTSSPK